MKFAYLLFLLPLLALAGGNGPYPGGGGGGGTNIINTYNVTNYSTNYYSFTNTVNYTNQYAYTNFNTTNVYAGQYVSVPASATLDASQPEQTIIGDLTFTGIANAPASGTARYVGFTVIGVSTVSWPQSWSSFNTNTVTLTNGLLAFKALGTSNSIAPYQP